MSSLSYHQEKTHQNCYQKLTSFLLDFFLEQKRKKVFPFFSFERDTRDPEINLAGLLVKTPPSLSFFL